MGKPRKPPAPSAASGSIRKGKKGKGLLASMRQHPGATAMGLLSIVFCGVVSVWQPLGPEKFARLW